MKALALIFVALLVTGLAVWTTQIQGGEVIAHVGDRTIRASLLMALLLGIATVFGALTLVGALARALETPRRVRKRYRERRRARVDALLARGLRELLEDRPESARQSLERAARMESGREILRLLAASACIRSGDRDAWKAHLLSLTDPDSQAASVRLKADGLIAAEEWEEALAVLQVLAGDRPDDPRIPRQLARCYRELRGWERLLELGRERARRENSPRAETQEWLRDAARHLCEDAGEVELKSLWPKLGEARDDPEVLRHYAGRLRELGLSHPELEQHLRETLDKRLDDAVIDLYGTIPGPVNPSMIKKVRKWLERDPDRVSLRIALARLHNRLDQFSEAREQLEVAEKVRGSPMLYRELAETLERMGESEAARELYRKGLRSLDENSY